MQLIVYLDPYAYFLGIALFKNYGFQSDFTMGDISRRNKMINIHDYVAIDPLALLLPSDVYVKWVEKLHPHVPKVAEIQGLVHSMTPEERNFTRVRARILMAHCKAIEEAITTLK